MVFGRVLWWWFWRCLVSLVVCDCCGRVLGLVDGCGGAFVLVFSYGLLAWGGVDLRCVGLGIVVIWCGFVWGFGCFGD